MRVSTKQLSLDAINILLDRQRELGKTQQQLATGRRILTPSDDPTGATRILNFKQSIQTTEKYQANIDIATQYTQLEETALETVGNTIRRIRELAIQGNNDSQNAETRKMIASEVRQRLDELLGAANTKNANGEYIFAGFQGKTRPFTRGTNNTFVYNGDQGQRRLQISETRQVASSDSGSRVFLEIKNGNGSFTVSDNLANSGDGIIDPGSVVDPTLLDGDTYSIVFPNATSAGATLAFNDVIGTDDTLSYSLQINGTTVYTVDETGTPINTLSGLANQINTASGTTNVRAYVVGSNLYLANVPPSAADIVVNESFSGFTSGDGDTVTGYFGSALTEAASSNTITLQQADATFYLVEDSQGNIETSGTYQDGAAITFNGYQTSISGTPRTSDSFSVSPSTNQSLFDTVQNLITALESGLGATNSTAALHNAVNRVLADLEMAEGQVLGIRAELGGRLNTLEDQKNLNADYILDLQQVNSLTEDLDYAKAVSDLNLQTVGLEAAQQSYLRIQNLSLFNFL